LWAAGINLTFYIQQLLELRSATRSYAGRVPFSQAGRHFIDMLDENDHAFEEVYVASFEVLDRIWLDRAASYMEFPAVMTETMAVLKQAMLQCPQTIADLREGLGLEAEGL
jgi:ELMO domain-containing protein